MIRAFMVGFLTALGVACLPGGGGDEPTATATATAGPAATGTTTATSTATPAPEAAPVVTPRTGRPTPGPVVEAPLEGRHFRATVPASWLYLDSEQPPSDALTERIEGLPAAAQEAIAVALGEPGGEVIFTGLPRDASSQIRVASLCDDPWDQGPGDWDRLMQITHRQGGRLVDLADAIVQVEELPYPVYEVRADGRDIYSVHLTSVDGCVYGISHPIDAQELDTFVSFLEGLELGRAGGASEPASEDPLIPVGWRAIAGEHFDAAIANEWLYNLTGAPLTAEQAATIASLPADVAAEVQFEQDTLDGLEIIYLGLPLETDTTMTVLSFCGLSFTRTPSEWAEEMSERRADQGSEMSLSGLTATVDGRAHDIYVGESPTRLHFDTYVVGANGCHYLFVVTPSEFGLSAVIDYAQFLQTVEIPNLATAGNVPSSGGRHFRAEFPGEWVVLDAAIPLPEATETTLRALAGDLELRVRDQLTKFEGGQLIYPTLLTEGETYIAVTTTCGEFGLTAAGWENQIRTRLQQAGSVVFTNGTKVTIAEAEYDAWDAWIDSPADRVDRVVMPISIDGCGYTFTLVSAVGDAAAYGVFLSFLETLRLSKDF